MVTINFLKKQNKRLTTENRRLNEKMKKLREVNEFLFDENQRIDKRLEVYENLLQQKGPQ